MLLLLKALLKALLIIQGVKPVIGPLARRRVSCIRMTLRSIGFAFTGLGGFFLGVLDAV
jgi:hypothetical protein